MVTEEMIRRLPKVALHDHIDGGLRPETILDLGRAQDVELPADNPEDLADWFHRGADRKTLTLYLEGFAVTVAVMQTEAALERVAYEAMQDLAEENVVYAELRFGPSLHTQRGLNLEQVVKAVLRGLERGREETGVQFGLLLCALRDRADSLEIAELSVAFRDDGVVGFDLAGDEYGHPPKRHLPAFEYIRQKNFNITIHAGEAFGPESIWQAVQMCGAHRIGHGVRLVDDMTVHGTRIEKMGTLTSFIRDKRLAMEICISSNIHTGAAQTPDHHPFAIFYRNNFRVCLNTDNRLMSNTSLSNEMLVASRHFNLTLDDLAKLTINAMKSAFITYEERLRIIYDILKPQHAKIKENILAR
jgi:adenosine deaminase